MNMEIAKRGLSVRGAVAAIAALTGLGLMANAMPPLALLNESASLPKGIYLRSFDQTPRRGAVVAVQPPPEARRYLASLGMPASVPLLKRIAAVSGDQVCRTGDQLKWSGRMAMARPRDRRGSALPAWSGCLRLGADELLVMGDTPTSFDSRYFGPVRRSSLTGVYVEALRW
jgi:conjugative transfer signal peptidase TraF